MTPMGMTLVKGLAVTASLLCLGLMVHHRSRSSPADSASVSPQLAAPAEHQPAQTAIAFEQRWLITASEAQQLIHQGATLLDARGKSLGQQRLPGAQPVHWDQFSPPTAPQRGRLLADDGQLTAKLQALGISADRPVVVFGDPLNGWGEEGRIVWMLRTLGHPQAVMVDGGIAALRQASRSPSRPTAPAAPREVMGDFVVKRRADWDIQQEQLKAILETSQLVIVDTREPREFAGQTPYGEQRGGHIPGAVHLYFKDVLDQDGKLLPKEAIANKLASLGITPESQVVLYCTGGIRSGWMTAVLTSLGFSAQNYAGSMWEWSASPASQYPLALP